MMMMMMTMMTKPMMMMMMEMMLMMMMTMMILWRYWVRITGEAAPAPTLTNFPTHLLLSSSSWLSWLASWLSGWSWSRWLGWWWYLSFPPVIIFMILMINIMMITTMSKVMIRMIIMMITTLIMIFVNLYCYGIAFSSAPLNLTDWHTHISSFHDHNDQHDHYNADHIDNNINVNSDDDEAFVSDPPPTLRNFPTHPPLSWSSRSWRKSWWSQLSRHSNNISNHCVLHHVKSEINIYSDASDNNSTACPTFLQKLPLILAIRVMMIIIW